MGKVLNVSLSPHEHGKETTRKLMMGVLIALIPAFLTTVWFFGYAAILVTGIAVISCLGFEYLIQKYILKSESRINDLSAIVTGVLLAFCLPVNIPAGIVVLGSLVAIGVGKMSFGGIGNNPFNPALVGRVFLFLSFPVQMTSWPLPKGFQTGYTDAVTGSTPLSVLNESYDKVPITEVMDSIPGHIDLLLGNMGGSLGEIAALALLIGFGYLLIRKIITWHIPVSIMFTIALFSGILWFANPEGNADPLYHLLSGGVMLGAIFMATDYVTSPMSKKGMLIYGIGIGLLTVIIRRWAAYPEGVQFAILIMNGVTPLINMYIKPKRFGEEVNNG
ncbi:MAG: RnfABCDGE type electron transport complex subunit D [Bacteroidales bacterium]|jgi:Na+-translocating ferredoxin:NAD+ oxidoreductase subunit D|nr:RnfABCDGE type electron transport complex subunit D [Bacteroidales bacterium]